MPPLSQDPLSHLQPQFQVRERTDGRGSPQPGMGLFPSIALSCVASHPPAGGTVTVSPLCHHPACREGQESNLGPRLLSPSAQQESKRLCPAAFPPSHVAGSLNQAWGKQWGLQRRVQGQRWGTSGTSGPLPASGPGHGKRVCPARPLGTGPQGRSRCIFYYFCHHCATVSDTKSSQPRYR